MSDFVGLALNGGTVWCRIAIRLGLTIEAKKSLAVYAPDPLFVARYVL